MRLEENIHLSLIVPWHLKCVAFLTTFSKSTSFVNRNQLGMEREMMAFMMNVNQCTVPSLLNIKELYCKTSSCARAVWRSTRALKASVRR